MKVRKWMIFGLLFLLTILGGCQVIEPEKRAYPLVLGIDRQEGRYQVFLGMVPLEESTGQKKEGAREEAEGRQGTLYLEGENREEIQEIYNRTQELYLDMGHVEHVIFGEQLWRDPEQMQQVLKVMEREHTLGTSPFVFRTEDLSGVMEEKGDNGESLGDYLTGFYENRMEPPRPVHLTEIYRNLHNNRELPEIPEIRKTENGLYIENARVVQENIAGQVIRFRVLAASNRRKDQQIKIQVRDAVLQYIKPFLQDSPSASESEQRLREQRENILETAGQAAEGQTVSCRIGNTWFPQKTYGACTFPEGTYQALEIRIGEGKGHNWWCVLYPALCFSDAVQPYFSETGKKKLQKILDEDAYDFLLHPRPRRIRFRWLPS